MSPYQIWGVCETKRGMASIEVKSSQVDEKDVGQDLCELIWLGFPKSWWRITSCWKKIRWKRKVFLVANPWILKDFVHKSWKVQKSTYKLISIGEEEKSVHCPMKSPLPIVDDIPSQSLTCFTWKWHPEGFPGDSELGIHQFLGSIFRFHRSPLAGPDLHAVAGCHLDKFNKNSPSCLVTRKFFEGHSYTPKKLRFWKPDMEMWMVEMMFLFHFLLWFFRS